MTPVSCTGLKKTSFTYENQTLLHRFFLFPISFILLLFFFLSSPCCCLCLCHTLAGNRATGCQRSSFKTMPWCLSQHRRAKLYGGKGMPWQGLRAAPPRQQAQGEGGCFCGQQCREQPAETCVCDIPTQALLDLPCYYLTQLHTSTSSAVTLTAPPKTGLRCYHNNGKTVGFRLLQLMALRVLFSSLFTNV